MNPLRKPIIAGNWKMYKTAAEALVLVNTLKREIAGIENVEVVVCPPFTALYAVSTIVADSSDVSLRSALQDGGIQLGAQNVHWEKEGAFTGEIAPAMLKELFVRYAIVGHSERRQFFGETDAGVNKRAKAALANGLRPIVCVGETFQHRDAGMTDAVVIEQLEGSLAGFTKDDILESVIAYEPVWAIGTGRNATPQQAQEVHRFIREMLERTFDAATAAKVRILYGGSVKPANAADLLSQPDVDGALVGGASLDAKGFADIVKSARGNI